MKQDTDYNENAANRKSYVGEIHKLGEKKQKDNILNSFPKMWAKLHRSGTIHIHDLDAYGLTYNCLTFDILSAFPYKRFTNLKSESKIIAVFDFFKELFAKMGNEQSGGMAFANFDIEVASIFEKLDVDFEHYTSIFEGAISSLIAWCNNLHTRMGYTSYYVTLNIGLGTSKFARFISSTLLDSFYISDDLTYKPNIVFKVKHGINQQPNDPNYDILQKALLCTCKKMIPTYLLCDCKADKEIAPENLSVMGCRTRVVDNLFSSEKGAIGRGNIANISINLLRIAFDVEHENEGKSINQKIDILKEKWINLANIVVDILIDRYHKTCRSDISQFPTNQEYKLWNKDIKAGLENMFKHGTLSIGFIGLSETMEIITKHKFWENKSYLDIAIDFVRFMRNYIDSVRDKQHLNFSLLATSGELISGRFVDLDKEKFGNRKVMTKNFYTNSFHIEVDSRLPAWDKIEIEGHFHEYTNGGSITYVELSEAPIGNIEGLEELVNVAIKSGVRYLGFNYPKDICDNCNASGTFDICPSCGEKTRITRVRRVSGYLEKESGFTKGKTYESKTRKPN